MENILNRLHEEIMEDLGIVNNDPNNLYAINKLVGYLMSLKKEGEIDPVSRWFLFETYRMMDNKVTETQIRLEMPDKNAMILWACLFQDYMLDHLAHEKSADVTPNSTDT